MENLHDVFGKPKVFAVDSFLLSQKYQNSSAVHAHMHTTHICARTHKVVVYSITGIISAADLLAMKFVIMSEPPSNIRTRHYGTCIFLTEICFD